ncbi:MAG: class II fructose-bisphosphate aldolase [Christensenellales bacterium]
MLVTMKEILDHANAGMYGVPAPNVGGEREARAAIEAAEEMCSPLIIDVGFKNHPDIVFLGSYLTRLAQQSQIPIAINFDHAGDQARFREPMIAVRAGFTGIMVDRSTWPYEDNVAEVKLITEMAHSLGISVESELGHVGAGLEYKNASSGFTDPIQAKDFIDRTGIDCLAIAIGTAHGAYSGIPKLDFNLLVEIKKKTNGFPLVMHGGSGTGDENCKKACKLGINKVNVSHELQSSAAKAVQAADLSGNNAYNVWKIVTNGWKERLLFLFENYGSAGKAWEVKAPGVGVSNVTFSES